MRTGSRRKGDEQVQGEGHRHVRELGQVQWQECKGKDFRQARCGGGGRGVGTGGGGEGAGGLWYEWCSGLDQ